MRNHFITLLFFFFFENQGSIIFPLSNWTRQYRRKPLVSYIDVQSRVIQTIKLKCLGTRVLAVVRIGM